MINAKPNRMQKNALQSAAKYYFVDEAGDAQQQCQTAAENGLSSRDFTSFQSILVLLFSSGHRKSSSHPAGARAR